eukprot:CCRYP_002171-RA/>CCRYP_002171-RA protein AED:0.39 eAED:0.39 QI:0/0/0/1/0/0/5/0/250
MKLHCISEEIIWEYKVKSLVKLCDSMFIIVLVQLGIKLVPGLWCHKQRPIQFSLVVDNFGVKYTCRKHVHHLLIILDEHNNVTVDWKGARYIGITLDWDYAKRQVHLPISGYVAKSLNQFNQQGQHIFNPIGHAGDPKLLCPISSITSQSAHPTEDTMKQTHQLLDYLASHDNSQNKARIPPNNESILNIAHIIKHVMACATEDELGALFITACNAVYLCIILIELGHKQPAKPIQTDNSMAEDIINVKV